MKIDWCKDSGQWNIWDINSGHLLAKVEHLTLMVPCEFIQTDGGRHGYVVAAGELVFQGRQATIQRRRQNSG